MHKSDSTIIDLIRHGEPVGGQRLRGSQDDPLSETGWEQMNQAVKYEQAWSRIVSSPLLRCQAFAKHLANQHKLELDIRPSFQEIGFGAWEGIKISDLMNREPNALRNYWLDPDNHAPEGAETMSKFVERIHRAWEELIDTYRSEHVLLVCHGGVIRAILTKVLGMPNDKLWNIDVPYANVSRIIYHHFDDGRDTCQLKFHQAQFPQSPR